MIDVVIAGGSIIDGIGNRPLQANIAISKGRIVEIGDINARAKTVLDATGLVVSPGFVDLHTHSDFTLAANGRAESQVHQGVTTEVVGQCGFSCAPASSESDLKMMAFGYIHDAVDFDWRTFAEYLEHLDKIKLGVNVAAFVGQGAIHRAVMGDKLSTPNDDELIQMISVLEESLEGGAYGLSSGLEYWPGSLSTPEQLTELAKIAAKHDVLYATHVRNRGVHYDIGFSEAISTARAAGARLQISHIQPKFGAPSHAMSHAMEMCDHAKKNGVDVAFDVIPHDWAHTVMRAILPQWAQEGGISAMRKRLKDTATREKIKQNPQPMWGQVSAGHWDKIKLLYSESNKDLVGMNFREIGEKRRVNPYDAVLDLLLEEGDDMGRLMWTSHSFSDDDIQLALSHSDCAVISDTLALAPYGCLKHHIGSLSGYGWAARYLQHYVRDCKIISLEEGIRRITSLPADRLGVTDRGRLVEGAWADVTVFDPEVIESHCDVNNPRIYATGIAHVLVNGEIAMRGGVRTEVDNGMVLRPN